MVHHKELEMLDKAKKDYNLKSTYTTKDDKINKPSHYNEGKIECIDAIEANLTKEEFIGYLRGNVKKYEWRCRYKGHMEDDLAKAAWYLNKLLKVIKYEE